MDPGGLKPGDPIETPAYLNVDEGAPDEPIMSAAPPGPTENDLAEARAQYAPDLPEPTHSLDVQSPGEALIETAKRSNSTLETIVGYALAYSPPVLAMDIVNAPDYVESAGEYAARATQQDSLGAAVSDVLSAIDEGKKANQAAENFAGSLVGGGAAAAETGTGQAGSQVLRGFHGAKPANIAGIINKKAFIPNANSEVFLSRQLGDTFQHGVDRSRAAAFSIEVSVSPPSGASVSHVAVPGNAQTMLITSAENVPATVERMHVRTGTRDEGFSTEVVEGAEEILRYLGF